MDKYNVIDATDNLQDLDKDYADWCNLPFDIRMRSNDECMKRFNCYVPNLYYKYRNSILNAIDLSNVEDDNLVQESQDIKSDYKNYEEILYKSRKLCKDNPYIIIIDPSIEDLNELENIYNSFNSLNSKNRRLSNDYSWQLWGYDVINMYNKMKSQLDPDFLDSCLSQYDSNVIAESLNLYNHFTLSNIINGIGTIGETLSPNQHDVLMYNCQIDKIDSEILPLDKDILPKIVPWFTEEEYKKYNGTGYNFKLPDDYYTRLKSADKYELLKLGWNPNVPVNEDTMKIARDRLYKWLSDTAINIKDFTVTDFSVSYFYPGEVAQKPIYLLLEHEPSDIKNIAVSNYTKIGISFDATFRSIFTLNFSNGNFSHFSIESFKDYKYTTVLLFYISEKSYNRLQEITRFYYNKPYDINVNSLYDILANTINHTSPDNNIICYTSIINSIIKIMNYSYTNYEFKYNKSTVYKVLSENIGNFINSKNYSKITVIEGLAKFSIPIII